MSGFGTCQFCGQPAALVARACKSYRFMLIFWRTKAGPTIRFCLKHSRDAQDELLRTEP